MYVIMYIYECICQSERQGAEVVTAGIAATTEVAAAISWG